MALAKPVNLHEHQKYGALWTRWYKERVESAGFATCTERHSPQVYVRLTRSFALDRLPELVAAADIRRLGLLWAELASGWNETYEPALRAEFTCEHGHHHAFRPVWQTPSLLAFCLEEFAWTPAWRRGQPVLERPAEVWHNTTNQPLHVLREAAILPADLDSPAAWSICQSLHVSDCAHLAVPQLVQFLQRLAASFPEPVEDMPADVRDSARWAMRQLNRSTLAGPWPKRGTIPLLARRGSTHLFTVDPVVASDPGLAELFCDAFPILDADRDQTALPEILGLDDLRSSAKPSPRPTPTDAVTAAAVQERIQSAFGPILALLRGQIPSGVKEASGHLQRLAITACTKLEIAYAYKGETRPMSADAHIFFSIEQAGRTRRKIGTAYLTVDADGPVNLYELGRQFATYLDAPTLGDGIAILLRDPADRRYLASRRISTEAVADAWEMLGRAPAEEPDPLAEVGSDFWKSVANAATMPASLATAVERQPTPGPATTNVNPAAIPNLTPPRPPLPPVDFSKVTVVDAKPTSLPPLGERSGGQRPPGALTPGWTDFAAQQRWTTELGDRAEEIVLRAEQDRLVRHARSPHRILAA